MFSLRPKPMLEALSRFYVDPGVTAAGGIAASIPFFARHAIRCVLSVGSFDAQDSTKTATEGSH